MFLVLWCIMVSLCGYADVRHSPTLPLFAIQVHIFYLTLNVYVSIMFMFYLKNNVVVISYWFIPKVQSIYNAVELFPNVYVYFFKSFLLKNNIVIIKFVGIFLKSKGMSTL